MSEIEGAKEEPISGKCPESIRYLCPYNITVISDTYSIHSTAKSKSHGTPCGSIWRERYEV